MIEAKFSTTQKALAINLDREIYGTIAEIGAGQETARHFFQAGGAAGTIARSMSAYDMKISDSIYGQEDTGRYVCESRVNKMLGHEFGLLKEILEDKRGSETRFFAFANTVATRSFSRPDAEAHGWLGVRFQHQREAEPSDVVIHIRLLEGDFVTQQEIVGVVGVNFIYSVFNHLDNPALFVESLVDNLAPNSVEVDYIDLNGPAVKHINRHLMSLHLVKANLTHAILFDANGKIKQPAEVLYKKPILVQRGSFRPITHVNMDMQNCAVSQFMKEEEVKDKVPAVLMEITMTNLTVDGEIGEQDFLDRINLLTMLGNSVLITNFPEHYVFAKYLLRNSRSMYAIVLGISNLREVFKEKYYKNLKGGILEACGRLFSGGGKLYIYPEYDKENDAMHTAANLDVPDEIKGLYHYLLERGSIVDLTNVDVTKLDIFSREVLSMINNGEQGWEKYVPDKVVEVIKINHLWGAH